MRAPTTQTPRLSPRCAARLLRRIRPRRIRPRRIGRKRITQITAALALVLAPALLFTNSAGAQSAWQLLQPDPKAGGTEQARPRIVLQSPSDMVSESLRFMLDDVDVTEFVETLPRKAGVVHFRWRSPVPLEEGEHRVTIFAPGRRDPLASFTFRRVPPTTGVSSSVVVRDGSTLEWKEDRDTVLDVAPHSDGRLEGRQGRLEWDVTSPHDFNLEGSNPDAGRPDAVLRFESRRRSANGPTLRGVLGTVRNPRAFGARRLIRMPSHRQIIGVGAAFGSQEFHAFSNLGGGLPSAVGERGRGQDLQAASWSGRWLDGRLGLSLLGLDARDRSDLDTTGLAQRSEQAEVLAVALHAQLSESWLLTGEFAWSERRERTDAAGALAQRRIRAFTGTDTDPRDTAFQLALEGALAGTEFELRARRVDTGFLNPVDPGLQADREEAELRVDRRADRWNIELRALRAEDGTSRATSSNREDLVEMRGGVEIAGFDLQAHITNDRTDGAGIDAEHDRWTLTLRRNLGGVRLTAQHGVTDVASTSSVGTRVRRREDSTTKSRLSFDWEAWRSDRSRLRLRAGGSSQSRDQLGRASMETREWFLDPTLELLERRLRLNLRVGTNWIEQNRTRDERRQSARLSVAYELNRRRALAIQTGFDWGERDDRLRLRSETDRRWSLALTWTPEWRFGQ